MVPVLYSAAGEKLRGPFFGGGQQMVEQKKNVKKKEKSSLEILHQAGHGFMGRTLRSAQELSLKVGARFWSNSKTEMT